MGCAHSHSRHHPPGCTRDRVRPQQTPASYRHAVAPVESTQNQSCGKGGAHHLSAVVLPARVDLLQEQDTVEGICGDLLRKISKHRPYGHCNSHLALFCSLLRTTQYHLAKKWQQKVHEGLQRAAYLSTTQGPVRRRCHQQDTVLPNTGALTLSLSLSSRPSAFTAHLPTAQHLVTVAQVD